MNGCAIRNLPPRTPTPAKFLCMCRLQSHVYQAQSYRTACLSWDVQRDQMQAHSIRPASIFHSISLAITLISGGPRTLSFSGLNIQQSVVQSRGALKTEDWDSFQLSEAMDLQLLAFAYTVEMPPRGGSSLRRGCCIDVWFGVASPQRQA